MEEKGRQFAIKSIESLQAGTSTNLSGGLFEGFNVIKNRESPSEVSSILLFTDGLANYGITKTGDIVSAMNNIIKDYKKSVTTFTFGFGKDHDANMLKSISENGQGLYYYIEREDEIPQCFADCLGGLLSVVAQNILLKIKPNGSTKILKSLSKYKTVNKDGCFEIQIGDMYSEEKKDLLFEIEIPKLEAESSKHILVDFSIDYFNTISKKFNQSTITTIINRPDISEKKPNYDLDKQRNRIETNNVLEKAKKLADERNFSDAREMINKQIIKIEKSISGKDDFCVGFIKDLTSLLNGLVDSRTYESSGNKIINDFVQSSHLQRNAKVTYSTESYQNCEKREMKSKMGHWLSKK